MRVGIAAAIRIAVAIKRPPNKVFLDHGAAATPAGCAMLQTVVPDTLAIDLVTEQQTQEPLHHDNFPPRCPASDWSRFPRTFTMPQNSRIWQKIGNIAAQADETSGFV
jgi:hypothetical protein